MYGGANLFLGLSYFHGKGTNWQLLEAEYAGIERKIQNLPINDNQIIYGSSSLNSMIFHLNYTYFHLLYQNKTRNLYLFLTGSDLNFVNITLNNNYELINSSLAPGLYLETDGVKHRFFMQVSIPLISLSARSSYSTNTVQNYEHFDIWKDIQNNLHILNPIQSKGIYAKIGYILDLSHKTSLILKYDFNYLKISYPRELTSVSGVYSTGLIYKF
jgi:hypothetical protein